MQIPYKHQSELQEIKTDVPTQYKASQSLHLTKFIYSCADSKWRKKRRKKQKHISTYQSLLLCLYCAYPFWGQCVTPSLFLLLEKELQRWIPLISWKAVRQLAVIQRLGNCTNRKEQLQYTGCPTEILYPFGSGKTQPNMCWQRKTVTSQYLSKEKIELWSTAELTCKKNLFLREAKTFLKLLK